MCLLVSGCLFQPTPYIPPEVEEVEERLEFTSPSAGDWVSDGPLWVTGVASGMQHVLLNGEEVAVQADGSFAHELTIARGVQQLELTAQELDGDDRFDRRSVMAGSFGDPNLPVRDAVALRINQGGIDLAVDAARSSLDPVMLQNMAMAMNPLFQENIGIAQATANLTEITFGDIAITATPTAGAVALEVSLPDLYLHVPIVGSSVITGAIDVDAEVFATRVIARADMTLSVVDGQPTVALSQSIVSFENLVVLAPGLPSFIPTSMVRDAVEDALTNMLPHAIDTNVPPVLENTIADLSLDFSLDVLGAQIDAGATFATIDIDAAGIAATLDMTVDSPSSVATVAPGYLLADMVPSAATTGDVSLGISDDVVNLLLFQAWSSGAMDIDMDLGTVGGEAPLAAVIGDGAITVDAGLPPVVVEAGAGLTAEIGELGVFVDTPDGAFGDYLELAAAVTSQLDLSEADGVVHLGLGLDDADVTLEARDSDWGAVDDETLTNMVEVAVPVDQVLSAFEAVEIPVPALRGMVAQEVGVSRGTLGRQTDVLLNF